jgi:hypothetical protein
MSSALGIRASSLRSSQVRGHNRKRGQSPWTLRYRHNAVARYEIMVLIDPLSVGVLFITQVPLPTTNFHNSRKKSVDITENVDKVRGLYSIAITP